jgi:molybdenum ABC transporter molybdate-binding protein
MLSFTFKKCAILWLFFCLFFSTLNAGANPLENNDNNQIADPISAPNNIASADLEAEKQSTTEGLNDAEIVSKVNNPSEKIIKDKKAFDKSLNILASGSLTNVMQDIIKEYSVIKNISVNVVFDSPSELILDVEAGDLADVFISEYPKKMVELQQKGLIDGFNIVNLYSDNLVIVTAKNHPILNKIAGVKDPETILRIISTSDLLVLPDPDFDPAGAFAREALEKYNLWDLFRNKTYRVSSTRNALYLI